MKQELVGIHEIAKMAGVSRAAVANWRTRFPDDFPAPIAELGAGPVFHSSAIQTWLIKKGKNKSGMEGAYLLLHESRTDDIKIIGLFGSRKKANEAKATLLKQPGFREEPRGFSIEFYELDKISSWHKGYVTVDATGKRIK